MFNNSSLVERYIKENIFQNVSLVWKLQPIVYFFVLFKRCKLCAIKYQLPNQQISKCCLLVPKVTLMLVIEKIILKRIKHLEIIAGDFFSGPEVAELIRQHHMTSKIHHYLSLAILYYSTARYKIWDHFRSKYLAFNTF